MNLPERDSHRRIRWSLALALLLPCLSLAHTGSNSFLDLALDADRWVGRWDIAIADLEFSLGLDANADGNVTWGELKALEDAIAHHVFSRLTITADSRTCRPVLDSLQISHRASGVHAALAFDAGCVRNASPPVIDYRFLFDEDAGHRAFITVQAGKQDTSAILSPSIRRLDAAQALGAGASSQLARFLTEGVRHVLIGVDHVLFLVVLLLPSVLRREGGRWRAIRDPRRAFMSVLSLVTAFTCAHAITITLAALGLVTLPVAPVEAAIALTVLIAALNNVWPVMERGLVAAAFGVGLVHGLGFANALAELGLPAHEQLWSLLGFNLGVELGQAAVVVALFPLACWLRRSVLYHRVAVTGGSVTIALVAGYWLVERVDVMVRAVA